MAEKKQYTPDEIIEEVREIVKDPNPGFTTKLYRELILNSIKCKRDELDILDLKVLTRAMAEFRYAARVFKPYRDRRKVSIFGSARTHQDDPYYKLAVEFARQLVQAGFMVITGAADGIMKAGNVGAGAENSFGVNILLPFEQAANEVIGDDPKLITFKYFFIRKLFFLMEADAIALFPGGFGTHDEGFETLTLIQTGKATPMPLLLMELPDETYWESYDLFIREQLLKRGLISKEDRSLYRICKTAEEGVEWVTRFYSTYHSMRLVRNRLVVRLEKALPDEAMTTLEKEFGDVIQKGTLHRTKPLQDEQNEPDLWGLPRIVFGYDQKSPSRLIQMIHRINELGG